MVDGLIVLSSSAESGLTANLNIGMTERTRPMTESIRQLGDENQARGGLYNEGKYWGRKSGIAVGAGREASQLGPGSK